jgi:hypothetical protein
MVMVVLRMLPLTCSRSMHVIASCQTHVRKTCGCKLCRWNKNGSDSRGDEGGCVAAQIEAEVVVAMTN